MAFIVFSCVFDCVSKILERFVLVLRRLWERFSEYALSVLKGSKCLES